MRGLSKASGFGVDAPPEPKKRPVLSIPEPAKVVPRAAPKPLKVSKRGKRK